MAAGEIPGVTFYRTNDPQYKGTDHHISALYAAIEPLIPLGSTPQAPEGYHAVMWAAGHVSEGHISANFLARYCRRIAAGSAYNYAPDLYNHTRAHLARLRAAS